MAADEIYFSVDIEANGPIPGEYSMTSIGAVAGASTFYAEMRPISDKFDPEAVKVTGHSHEYLHDKEDPADVMKRFDRWVRDTAGKGRPVFVAFNATFDWMFVYWYLLKFVGRSPFSISGLDIKAYYMGMMNSTWGETVKREVRKKFPSDLPHTHNALDDAREQAQLFEALMAYNRTKPH